MAAVKPAPFSILLCHPDPEASPSPRLQTCATTARVTPQMHISLLSTNTAATSRKLRAKAANAEFMVQWNGISEMGSTG